MRRRFSLGKKTAPIQPGGPPIQQKRTSFMQFKGRQPMQPRKTAKYSQKRFSFFGNKLKYGLDPNSLDYWLTEENRTALKKILPNTPAPTPTPASMQQGAVPQSSPYPVQQGAVPQPSPYPMQQGAFPQQTPYPPQLGAFPSQPPGNLATSPLGMAKGKGMGRLASMIGIDKNQLNALSAPGGAEAMANSWANGQMNYTTQSRKRRGGANKTKKKLYTIDRTNVFRIK
jgi:hypothetical protein